MKVFSEKATPVQKALVFLSIPFVSILLSFLLEKLIVLLFGQDFYFSPYFLVILVLHITIRLGFFYNRLTEKYETIR